MLPSSFLIPLPQWGRVVMAALFLPDPSPPMGERAVMAALFLPDPSPPMGERAAVRAETPASGEEARAE